MSLKPLDVETARKILDFSGGNPSLTSLGQLQLEGAVALHNMIADPNVGMGYLADEVGMGKTYVALGVISLMRYFNPSLRVLYICPSSNVQEKWYSREYRSFCKHNVKVSQYRVRTPDGKPAVPRISCRNVVDLIRSASTGYYADIFVGMSSFSLALSEDEAQWRRKLEELKALLPAIEIPEQVGCKASVKEQYAAALNYVLPSFDLVVIDEAHNFKHDFTSSDRNRVLSGVLGFRDKGRFVKRVKHALLLSATPYDRDINQLRNQLKLVGCNHLLPDAVSSDEQSRIEACLSRFLVRRLNELQIAGKPHTRNMYRAEWRSGDKAEINLKSDEQKLVTALVQKKVGEMLENDSGRASFQTGLLASFESYAESTRSGPVEFDGDLSESEASDARDKHVIGALSDSYIQTGLGTTLPHPKMDVVTKRLADDLFVRGRKQIVFVRRVKSVKEIKNKLDDHYNVWLRQYIEDQLKGFPDALAAMCSVIEEYSRQSQTREDDISGGDFHSGSIGETEDRQPPKNDTLFAWFFRGEAPAAVEPLLTLGSDRFTTPEAMRIGLVAKNQVISLLLEINWAALVTRALGMNLSEALDCHGDEIARSASSHKLGYSQNDLDLFQASQLGFLKWLVESRKVSHLQSLVDHLALGVGESIEITSPRVRDSLRTHTFYCALQKAGLLEALFPSLAEVLQRVTSGKPIEADLLKSVDIHKSLLSLCLRTGHGVVDVYLARMRQGAGNLTSYSRAAWMDDLVATLSKQSASEGFCTYRELSRLAGQLDLIIKTNLPEIYDKSTSEYRKYLAQNLNPIAPIIGATGETVSTRSAQARKFRMPGYPLALISTDVFQEGEDLHTFCDSVMHYGLSGSPVSIEQKTGRVDRVGSKAQRRLLSIGENGCLSDDQLIQVTFPFVRESIEVFQVRQLCININAFIDSLHKIGADTTKVRDNIDIDHALRDQSAIPQQIRTRLASPYVPDVPLKSPELNREQFVEDQADHASCVIEHIGEILRQHFGRHVLDEEGVYFDFSDGTSKPITIALRAARASGEMLLSATVPGSEISLHGMSRQDLLHLMIENSWRTFHRTYAVETAVQQFRIYHDAELLVGDARATSLSEVQRFFGRFGSDHDPARYSKPQAAHIFDYWARCDHEQHANFGQFVARIRGFEGPKELGLTFVFGEKGLQRKHHVRIYELEGRCIFLAQAASPEVVKGLSLDQLVRFTWGRNQSIDLVEFVVDENEALIGRAIHPIDGMDYKEFIYCAYTLAASTDRLEYLIQMPDIH